MRSECKDTPARAGSRHTCDGRGSARRRAAIAIGALLLVGVHAAAVARDLAGRIWVPQEQRFTTPAEVEARVGAADFVLLGETHTVARHHVLQALFVRAAAADRKPAVVFEMIPAERQADIDRWRAAAAPEPADLGPAVGWTERGWPPWNDYAPIARVALDRGLPLRAGAPATTRRDAVARRGLGAILGVDPPFPGLDAPLPDAARERLRETLRRVHCGLGEHAPIDRMIAVQRLRDAAMARTMLRAQRERGQGAVLIAGHGHVRRDYGVPVYLERAAPGTSVLSIAFFGTVGAQTVAAQREAAGGTLPFDYVWFTDGGEAAPDCAAADTSGRGALHAGFGFPPRRGGRQGAPGGDKAVLAASRSERTVATRQVAGTRLAMVESVAVQSAPRIAGKPAPARVPSRRDRLRGGHERDAGLAPGAGNDAAPGRIGACSPEAKARVAEP